jgi:hypothetical protein
VSSVAGGASHDVFATCPAGKSLLGGGYVEHGNVNQNAVAIVNAPDPSVSGEWFVRIKNFDANPVSAQAVAICG